jgi:hypothetical protein
MDLGFLKKEKPNGIRSKRRIKDMRGGERGDLFFFSYWYCYAARLETGLISCRSWGFSADLSGSSALEAS